VTVKPTRRRYTAEYKLRILRETDTCTGAGEIGALLRREELCSSNLTVWRMQRERGELQGLSQKKQGPLPRETNTLAAKVALLERESARFRVRAERADAFVEECLNQASNGAGRTGGRRVHLSADGQRIETGSGGIEQGVIEAGGWNEERAGSTNRSREALQ